MLSKQECGSFFIESKFHETEWSPSHTDLYPQQIKKNSIFKLNFKEKVSRKEKQIEEYWLFCHRAKEYEIMVEFQIAFYLSYGIYVVIYSSFLQIFCDILSANTANVHRREDSLYVKEIIKNVLKDYKI